MPCSYSVTSEDTADFISTYSALPEQLSAMTGIECIDFVSRQFAVLHIPMDDLESPMNFSYYTYSAIPKLYSLLATDSMEASGILLTLLGIYRDAFPVPSAGTPSRGDNRLATATALIHSNYYHPDFNVEQLCQMLHCNRVTLYRLFQSELHTSPGSYLISYRMDQARKMLKMGMSVKTTALSCGFTDQFYFSRAFKEHAGMAPSEYRKM